MSSRPSSNRDLSLKRHPFLGQRELENSGLLKRYSLWLY